ncbi:hypothetical protein L3C95_32915 [Chitinophaga filiformis]|uniref:hypothetical protein n=1 Tax=Chitinophaga filiformis TaxID=104663 RepID=UPI001F3D5F34|nr:hypothetical protein [Chitinophaga filiformis]MCF6407736.1 hypothetical protein [Chitinophaga filiformis]
MDFNWNYTLRLKGLGGFGDGDVIQFDQRGGFFLFDDVSIGYNVNDAGQFIWGYGMRTLGFSLESSLSAAHAHSIIFGDGLDPKADQQAIIRGFLHTPTTDFRFGQPWGKGLPALKVTKNLVPDPGAFAPLGERFGNN